MHDAEIGEGMEWGGATSVGWKVRPPGYSCTLSRGSALGVYPRYLVSLIRSRSRSRHLGIHTHLVRGVGAIIIPFKSLIDILNSTLFFEGHLAVFHRTKGGGGEVGWAVGIRMYILYIYTKAPWW